MKLSSIVALVTGAGSGLGAATARHLADCGAHVVALDRDADAARKIAADIGGTPTPADITNTPEVEAALNAAEEKGPLRVLVNCAGIPSAGRIAGRDGPLPLEEFEKTIRINLLGVFNMMRLVAVRMQALDPLEDGERGVIVNTASVAAFDGQLGQVAYAASKGGIVSMALPAARELAKFGIRVNTIAPGVFHTPMVDFLPQDVQDGIAADIPFPNRLGDPDEFAQTVRYCIETRYLNAEVIRLDGGVRLPPK